MHTCISSHGLKRSRRSCLSRVNAGNKNTPSTHHPRRRNVTTLMVGLKNGHIRKNLTKNGEPQRYSWGTQKKKKKIMVLLLMILMMVKVMIILVMIMVITMVMVAMAIMVMVVVMMILMMTMMKVIIGMIIKAMMIIVLKTILKMKMTTFHRPAA